MTPSPAPYTATLEAADARVAQLKAADETIIFPDFIVHVMKLGRGYIATVEGLPSVRSFACRRSYVVSSVIEQVDALRCESCGVIEGARHNSNCG